MDISLRTKQLNSLFSYDKKTELEESHLEPARSTSSRRDLPPPDSVR